MCSIPVAGVFVAKTAHQIEAVKLGQSNGIDVVIPVEGSTAPGFNITFLRFDKVREVALRDIIMHVATGSFTTTGHDTDLTHRNAAREVTAPDRPRPTE